jgi:hypothetical protein
VADALNDPDNDSPWGPHRIFPLTVPADRLPVSALVLSDALDTEDPDYNREDALFMKTSFDPLTIQSLLMRKRGLIIIKGRKDMLKLIIITMSPKTMKMTSTFLPCLVATM